MLKVLLTWAAIAALAVAGGTLVTGQPMYWYWYASLGALAAGAYFHFTGQPGFWKLTRKHPEAALRFFESDPQNWIVFYETPPEGYRSVAPADKWTGPFRLYVYVPRLRNLVVVFGRHPTALFEMRGLTNQISMHSKIRRLARYSP